MRFILGLFFLLSSFLAKANSFTLPENSSVVIGCSIFQPDGLRLKSFPGRYCQFLEDGSVVSSTPKSLKLINPDNSVRWEIPGNYTRHVNLSIDKKRIITFRSYVDKSTKEFFREDEFLVIDLEGKILAQQKISELFPLAETWPVGEAVLGETEARVEKSHFNSIYEIPALKGKHDPRLKEGQVIVNSLRLGVFILSADLKTLVARFTSEELSSKFIHDVQITPEGKILFFNNRLNVPSGLLASGAQMYDPLKKKITYTFKANPPEIFYSECCGSAQVIEEKTLLLSGIMGGGHFIDMKSGKILQQLTNSTRPTHFGLHTVFSMKLVDLSGFLAKRKD